MVIVECEEYTQGGISPRISLSYADIACLRYDREFFRGSRKCPVDPIHGIIKTADIRR